MDFGSTVCMKGPAKFNGRIPINIRQFLLDRSDDICCDKFYNCISFRHDWIRTLYQTSISRRRYHWVLSYPGQWSSMKYEILNEEVSLTLRHEIDSQQNCVSLLVDDHGHQHDIRQQQQKIACQAWLWTLCAPILMRYVLRLLITRFNAKKEKINKNIQTKGNWDTKNMC